MLEMSECLQFLQSEFQMFKSNFTFGTETSEQPKFYNTIMILRIILVLHILSPLYVEIIIPEERADLSLLCSTLLKQKLQFFLFHSVTVLSYL